MFTAYVASVLFRFRDRACSVLRPLPLCVARGGAAGWGNALQAGRSRVRFPIVSLQFFVDIILPDALGLTQPLTEMSTRNISWGVKRPVRRADNLTTFICRVSWNLGATTSWSPRGLSRPVMGLLYLYLLRPENRKFFPKEYRDLRDTTNLTVVLGSRMSAQCGA